MTSDKSILQLVSGSQINFTRDVRQVEPCHPLRFKSDDKSSVDLEITNYLRQGIIEKAVHSSEEFICNIFPRPKRSGGVRIILNLKPLNVDVEYIHFKMENLKSVLQLMDDNCFMASIDLKDAYYSVNIHESFRKYLRFFWEGQLYQFTCLPNGLTSAPRCFTKLLKPVFSKLRSEGFVSVYYLDDTWLMGRSVSECLENVKSTIAVLEKACFLINCVKSLFQPSQTVTFLGFVLNSVNMTVTLPHDKRIQILEYCQSLLHVTDISIRYVSTVIGTLVASLPAVQYGALFYRYLEYDKIQALKCSAGNFDALMCLGSNAHSELQWWIANIMTCFNPIKIKPYSHLLSTDASQLGWGAHFGNIATGGHWKPQESLFHINELELMAVLFGLQCFCSQMSSVHIRVRSDNITAATYINNFGGVRSLNCHKITKQIWSWCLERNIHISAEHLPGSENTVADSASRIFNDNTEWTIDSDVYSRVVEQYGPFSIDFFASRLNAKQSVYASWQPDPEALFVDAFSRPWKEFNNFYAFPPFSLVLRCLQKVAVEQARGVIIVPMWPTQPWFPKLTQMLISVPLLLPKNVLSLPFNNAMSHKLHRGLYLLACPISGLISEARAFRNSLSISCATPGDHLQSSSIKSIIKSGFLSVVSGRKIPCYIMKR